MHECPVKGFTHSICKCVLVDVTAPNSSRPDVGFVPGRVGRLLGSGMEPTVPKQCKQRETLVVDRKVCTVEKRSGKGRRLTHRVVLPW